ncbi:MAG: c-type cytochrome domain-containing protein [Cyclobacteriaceae bacterium]
MKLIGIVLPLIFIGGYGIIYFLPEAMESSHPILHLIGRFHPLILHFPIVLFLLVTGFIILGQLNTAFKNPIVIKILLLLTSILSFSTILAGYLLFVNEEYGGKLVNNHFLGALLTGTGISLCTAIYFYGADKNKEPQWYKWTFYVLLGFSNVSLLYASHMGGSLTHGEDYLSDPLAKIFPEKKFGEKKPLEEMLLYENMIATILESKCANCHNENKSKGDLMLSSHTALLKAGKSGNQAVTPHDVSKSELIARIMLPEEDEDRMPPEGKANLTQGEIDLITFWVEEGASDTLKYGEIRNEVIQKTLQKMLPSIQESQISLLKEKEAFEETSKKLKAIGAPLGMNIERDKDAEGRFLGLKMKFPPQPISNQELLKLMPYAPYFSRISLASSNVSDDELYYLGKMINLERLVLQKTAISGTGLPYLQQNPNLKVLNLSFTPLEDGNLLHILNFPVLEKLYLFGTPVKKDLIEALQAHKPELEIILEEGPFY